MFKVLVTGAGSGGAENLIRSLRACSLDLEIYGSNVDEYTMARTEADHPVYLPGAGEESYIEVLGQFAGREGIDLVVANNDKEVARVSKGREELPCAVFLPDDNTVTVCQDKLRMHRIFEKAGIKQARFRALQACEDIDEFMKECPCDTYWIRTRRGLGSIGATRFEKAHQAKAWISLWTELRGFKLADFVTYEFLP